MARDTLIDFFGDLSQARGEFLVYDDGFRSRGYSYGEVASAARGLAARLDELGLRKGDKVVFWSENRPEWIVAFWACLLRGVIVVPVDYRASPDFLARVVRIVSARLILIGQDVPPLTAPTGVLVWKLHELDWRADADAATGLSDVPIARDDSAEIIFTSGATAEPKGVVITHRNILANIVPVEHEILKYRKWGRPFFPLRFLNLLPLSHMFGQAMATFIPPMLPGTVIFMRGYNPVEIVAQIKRRKASVLVSVPKILDVLREHALRVDPEVARAFGSPERLALQHGDGARGQQADGARGQQRDGARGDPRREGARGDPQREGARGDPQREGARGDPRREGARGDPQREGARGDPRREGARGDPQREGARGDPQREGARGFQPSGKKQHVALRWWRYRKIHRAFGPKFWAFVVGAAPLDGALEAFWGELGFVVIQGYGLTETAPIVTLNHPFGTKKGSVGKAIAGVEVKVAPDGEILVRGDNVTKGYFNAPEETARAFEDGWFHTGDIGEIGEDRQLYIRGRKKEMIVTPEGLNVFPEDVERVLNVTPGVRDSAVVGVATGSEERVHAVLILEHGVDADAVVRQANAQLDDHQKIRRALVWPELELPRTDGTGKLKRAAIREWVKSGGAVPRLVQQGTDALAALVAKYAGRDVLSPGTTLQELGLSSLDRVELMVALEHTFQTRIDEASFAGAQDLSQLRLLVERASTSAAPPDEPVDFPAWTRSAVARAVRRVNLSLWILPIARLFAWTRIAGLEHLRDLDGPVIFASNHQSFMDGPVIMASLPARWRYRLAPAMGKEMFAAHFFPAQHGTLAWFTNSLNYYLAVLLFNAFPLPQREAGARQALRYMGELLADEHSLLIFPEGRRSETGAIDVFRPGIGMIASKLGAAVVPVRIDGLQHVLGVGWQMARPGRVQVAFGAPLRLVGEDYDALAKTVESAVRAL